MDRRTASGRLVPLDHPIVPVTHQAPASEGAVSSPARAPLRNRSFLIFWGGQSLASLGNMFAIIAMPLLVLQATGQVTQMGLVTATFTVGQLVAGLFAGQLIDALNRRVLMMICDAGRAVIYATIPLVWLFFGPQVWLIYVVTALGSVLGMIFQVGYVAAVPNLVEKDQIIKANGYINASMAISTMIGPLLGGVVVARFGPAIALSGQAAAFAVSALSLALVRLRPVALDAASGQERGMSALLAGVRYLFGQPVLCAVSVILLAYGLATGAGLDLFIFHIKSDLHQDGTAVGFVFAASSIGAIIGSLAAAAIRKRLGFGPAYLGAVILSGLPFMVIGLSYNLYVVAGLAAVFQLVSMVMGINSMSLRQEITPDALLGRVTAAFWTVSGVMTPLGAALGTALASKIGAPWTFFWMGLLMVLIGLAGVFSPARQRRPAGSALSATSQGPIDTAVESDGEAQMAREPQVAGV
jgi:MFS family permease